jgi:hypothetical protein
MFKILHCLSKKEKVSHFEEQRILEYRHICDMGKVRLLLTAPPKSMFRANDTIIPSKPGVTVKLGTQEHEWSVGLPTGATSCGSTSLEQVPCTVVVFFGSVNCTIDMARLHRSLEKLRPYRADADLHGKVKMTPLVERDWNARLWPAHLPLTTT